MPPVLFHCRISDFLRNPIHSKMRGKKNSIPVYNQRTAGAWSNW